MNTDLDMVATTQLESVGVRLKRIRLRLALSLREVEKRSSRLAARKKNPDYFISRGWLNNIENGTNTPSLCKQYALAAIYHVHWSSIFSAFGCDLAEFRRDQAMFPPPKTRLATPPPDAEQMTVVPVKFKRRFGLYRTNLLERLGKIWGEIPVRLIQNLDLLNATYGFVGMSDRTMFPIIRPGSIVQIDQNERKVWQAKWKDEDDRPIYFLELRGEFICSWCEIAEGYLSAVPHPKSKRPVRRFIYPRDVHIVGRVIGVTMRLVDAEEP